MDFEKAKLSEKAKLFVGGISRETSEDALRDHFSKYGVVSGSLVAKDRNTRSPRGFGFVWFSDPSIADQALQDTHIILGRTVEVKKAIPKSEQHLYQQQQLHYHPNQQRNSGFTMNSSNGNSDDYFRTKKIFVGGLSANLTEEQFKNYFERFGRIIDVVVMQDSSTNRPRGFGFVTFDSEESVDRVLLNTFHELNGRLVEVKRAVPKDRINSANSTHVTRNSVRGSSAKSAQPGNYPSYGPGYEIPPGYSPLPVYNGSGGYLYGTGVYGGGYPMVGYGRLGFGVAPIASRVPWSGPMMIGAGLSLYSNTCLYPAYMNDGGGIMGMMASGYNGIDGPAVNGKLGVFGGNGHLPPDAIPPLIEGVKLEIDSSSLKDSNGGVSS